MIAAIVMICTVAAIGIARPLIAALRASEAAHAARCNHRRRVVRAVHRSLGLGA